MRRLVLRLTRQHPQLTHHVSHASPVERGRILVQPAATRTFGIEPGDSPLRRLAHRAPRCDRWMSPHHRRSKGERCRPRPPANLTVVCIVPRQCRHRRMGAGAVQINELIAAGDQMMADLVRDALRCRTVPAAGKHAGKIETVERAASGPGLERRHVGHRHAHERAPQLVRSEFPKDGPYRVRPLVFIAVDASQHEQSRPLRLTPRHEHGESQRIPFGQRRDVQVQGFFRAGRHRLWPKLIKPHCLPPT